MARGARAISPRSWRRALADPHAAAPTAPPPGASDLSGALSRNIEAIARRREADAANTIAGVRIAMRVGTLIGRMRFVYANAIFYGAWIIGSRGWLPGIPAFDTDLYLIGSVASVESIFLSIFILIAQNRAAAAADRRDDLSLQVGLLAEHEITQLIKLTAAIAHRLGIDPDHHSDIADLQTDVAPEAVLDRIEREEPRDAAD